MLWAGSRGWGQGDAEPGISWTWAAQSTAAVSGRANLALWGSMPGSGAAHQSWTNPAAWQAVTVCCSWESTAGICSLALPHTSFHTSHSLASALPCMCILWPLQCFIFTIHELINGPAVVNKFWWPGFYLMSVWAHSDSPCQGTSEHLPEVQEMLFLIDVVMKGWAQAVE